jgi:hypothetical protein
MFRIVLCLLFLTTYAGEAFSQICTVTGTSPLNWPAAGASCSEGGTAVGKTILIIPANFTVIFDTNTDTWTGTRIDVYGTLQIDKDVQINSSITVYNGGKLILLSKLSMGSSPGCGFGLSIKPGATVDVGGAGSDRLSICGKELMKGNGSCNSCGGDNSGDCLYDGKPYCEPTGGFTGPLGYDEEGYDVVLPIKLASITAKSNGESICLNWSTASEKNFNYFVIEASTDGQQFDSLGVVPGQGESNQILKYTYTDVFPMIGKNYYRLKSVDHDLTFEYSPLVVEDFYGSKNVVVFPNPAIDNTITVQPNFSIQEGDRIEIYDNVGVMILALDVSDNGGVLPLNNALKQGSYLLRYVSHAHTQIIRFNYH